MGYRLIFTRQALKDAKLLERSALDAKAKSVLKIIQSNPFKNPPPYEKLIGNMDGLYSRRINIQNRIVYEVIESQKTVKIIRMWTHYE